MTMIRDLVKPETLTGLYSLKRRLERPAARPKKKATKK